MKYDFNNSLGLAWFRLYEAFKRNEHEKVFSNYRLLSHSFEVNSFKFQSKGDIHLFFNEIDLAKDSYNKAFEGYLNENNFYGVSIILGRILFIHDDIKEYIEKIPKEKIENNKLLFSLFV